MYLLVFVHNYAQSCAFCPSSKIKALVEAMAEALEAATPEDAEEGFFAHCDPEVEAQSP